jgi:hypothetical protein
MKRSRLTAGTILATGLLFLAVLLWILRGLQFLSFIPGFVLWIPLLAALGVAILNRLGGRHRWR